MKGQTTENNQNFSQAVFGGGCFWCLEAILAKLKGVIKVTSGYAGGTMPNPTYEKVCSGKTGHAEVMKIGYDPKEIAFKDLLSVFFAMHDPTTFNRQGTDEGTQYRSIILYSDEKQKNEAEKFIEKLEKEKIFKNQIVTEVKRLENFYPAEDYHQNYFANNPEKPYCQTNISPKITKLRKNFSQLLKN
ncbi:MAG: peptide-methionine (S)-S-oxide reductase [Candidatus Moranbacteria bacterium RIFOXYB1_FULL_43_19]|nr:MAG: peptide-methionine (S)-S-oxide reductase [Candidatus Moranbacteria bacterium RIFOXYB1_FULL_43_19]OGI27899.1 MAG: peptide-methionine (S)-S-oxide reductase [Candidatus Moranbacteria bacterium RIFOXYA1_FULL_44_7]OGI32514.1 MAG: peptide-methionine (S)-S-oxide reductase [Candidatus Moranbacteria bacterium RIFOXYC1_FULL_44_13]OGI38136.1 MAG: peptide-methionine (S)-S-oxide reductase [Candidatus Moranbacteria bacterium RIFOXYD1_FULL_44_12]